MKSNLASAPSSEATKLKTDPLQGPSVCLADAALGHSIKEKSSTYGSRIRTFKLLEVYKTVSKHAYL